MEINLLRSLFITGRRQRKGKANQTIWTSLGATAEKNQKVFERKLVRGFAKMAVMA